MEAASCEVTDTRRLDRYPLEQILTLKKRTRLLLLISKSEDAKKFMGKASEIHNVQQLPTRFISGREYYQLKCSLNDCTLNEQATKGAAAGLYKIETFRREFNRGIGSFAIDFDGTSIVRHFTWRDVIANPSTFMFFGPPLDISRSYDRIFQDVGNIHKLHNRFVCYYDHFEGDVRACLALFNAYLSARVAMLEKMATGKATPKSTWDVFSSDAVMEFLKSFDQVCKESIESVLTEFNNHAEPIISTPTMEHFIAQAPSVFGDVWDLLCELRGVKPNVAREENRTDGKLNDMFFLLLIMARFRNRSNLVYWALVQNISLFARGVGRSAECTMAYFGMALANTTRRRLFDKLTGNDKEGQPRTDNTLRQKQGKGFRACAAIIFAYDNYQKGLTLQHQRGKHSSAFFKGTHEVAHKVLPFTDCTFDEMHAVFTQHDQDIPSPWGMPAFEIVDRSNPASFFIEYESFDTVVTPDFSGDRVRAYLDLKNIAHRIKQLSLAFPSEDETGEYFDQCPDEFNRGSLESFRDRLHSKESQRLVKAAKSFQSTTVKKWNPNFDEQTLSIYLGLIGIDEAASKECGAISLDLLLRAGVLEADQDGDWQLADDWNKRRIYIYGDAKTIENMTKFIRDMQDRRISYSVANLQAEVFLKAMTVVMELPGDWHTGLNMAQSIFNVFYTGFLDEFQGMLEWKRVNPDVSQCYFQAARLIAFVHDELMRFFTHQYISGHSVEDRDVSADDPSYLASTAVGLNDFLAGLKQSKDKWIATCGVFLELAEDFLEFVEAYRLGDAVAIEAGYLKHAPAFKVLGQNKYVEIWLGQQECLYRDNPFSRLQEVRINRVVRRHIGKRGTPLDEFLEHGNRSFSEFPMPRSLAGFANQSIYVGVGLKSKVYDNRWYSTYAQDNDTTNGYTRTVVPCMTPEKRYVYAVFRLLCTHQVDSTRVGIVKGYVSSVKSKVTIKLTRKKLENSMHDNPATSCDEILQSLSTTYQESIDKQAERHVNAAEELSPEDMAEASAEEPSEEETRPTRQNKKEKITKREIHDLIGQDLWELGKDEFAEKDILAVRAEGVRRRKMKSELHECILEDIRNSSAGCNLDLRGDKAYMPSWQKAVRSRRNNLRLRKRCSEN